MVKTQLLIIFAAIGLSGCMDDADWQAAHDNLGSSYVADGSVYHEPYPFSENEEAAIGPKAYDTETRLLDAQNHR